ncbi:MAG: hypothetical protein E6G02_07650 [Actinobacteria bacterium]|nr:MAG: hypothetical protein E6G02_07650 [Actinomycetota bacterium]
MPTRVVVVWRAGPTWTSGGVREQPGWDAHAEFIDALIANGTFVMGGPFADNSGSMSLLEGVNADEARRIIAGDPFVENGVFVLDEVREWDVFVDELTAGAEPRPNG